MSRNDDITAFRVADVIDGRDVAARIADLEAERDEYVDARLEKLGEVDENDTNTHDAYASDWTEAFPDEAEELRLLEEFHDEATGYAGDGADYDAIAETYFEAYAKDLAEDVGAISGKEDWPLTYIDWPRAADALKQDYSSVELDGVEFWVRS